MAKDNTLNMTEGNTVKLLITFSIPMLIGNIFQQLYNIVDSVVVGKFVGKDALASIGATNSLTFLFFALCNGIGNGGGIVTSQYFGSGDKKNVKRCITNVGYIMLIFPAIVAITAFLAAEGLLVFLHTPEELLADSITYMRIICCGMLFVSLYNFISSMLRALGDSKTPLYFLIFSCTLNAILDLIFVRGLGLSVAGAGIATIISQFVSAIGSITYAVLTNPYFKLEKEDWKFDKIVTKKAIRVGVPLSLQFALIAVSTMAVQRVVNSFETIIEGVVAAFTATSRIEQLVHMPYQTLSAALSTYTGQNYGARKKDRVQNGLKQGIILMAAFTVIMFVIMQLFGRNIAMIFIKKDEIAVIDMVAKALKINSWFYIFLGLIYTVRGVLNGLGDVFFSIYNGVIEVLGRFTVPFLLTSIPAIGVWGIWWSVGVVWSMAGISAWFRYLYYRKKSVFADMEHVPQ